MKALRCWLLAVSVLFAAACSDEDAPLAPDRSPPAIVSMAPADGAVGVSGTLTVRVVFDEPISPPDSTALVVRSASGLVPGAVALDSTATALTFAPLDTLALATDYTLTLAAGIEDLAGNARPDSLVTRFSTALAFHSVGRLFIANDPLFNPPTIDVLDIQTDQPVPGSPIRLEVTPIRFMADSEAGELYLLYATEPRTATGIRVFDGATLAVVRDSEPILPADAVHLALSREHGLLFVVAPESNTLHVLDAQALIEARAPVRFENLTQAPVRVAVAHEFDYVLVALDGGAWLQALRLPDFMPVEGFPVASVTHAHTIVVDGPRGRAWVGGRTRYAVVDFINPARTQSFQMPACDCAFLWSMIFDPAHDRVYFADRFHWVLAVRASDLGVAPESPGENSLFNITEDIVQDPRTGDFILLGWDKASNPIGRMRRDTLEPIPASLQFVGEHAIDLEVLP